jgi:glycerophosphoryl diester phosphodiesterase
MEDEVVIQSFSPIVCAIVRAEARSIRTEFLGPRDDKDPVAWDEFVRWGQLLDVAGMNARASTLTEERIAAFHRSGKQVAVWTVNEEDDMRRLAAWGADSIITDRPDVCLRVFAAKP